MLYFSQTILYVEDVRKALDFYKTAFDLNEKFITGMEDYAEIESNMIALAFAKKKFVSSHLPIKFLELGPQGAPPPFEICFVVDNVDQAYLKAVEAGATTVAEPKEKSWGQRVAYVRDPDGFLIEIGQKME